MKCPELGTPTESMKAGSGYQEPVGWRVEVEWLLLLGTECWRDKCPGISVTVLLDLGKG